MEIVSLYLPLSSFWSRPWTRGWQFCHQATGARTQITCTLLDAARSVVATKSTHAGPLLQGALGATFSETSGTQEE